MIGLLSRRRASARAALRRTRHIARVLGANGLESIAEATGLRRFLPRFGKDGKNGEVRSQAERLRVAFGELGVTFIKLGQMLSTRADLLPPDVIAELSKLQDSAPPVPFEEIRRILMEDLPGPKLGSFAWIEQRPLASASIGQVHEALLCDGTAVVIKVRRPGVVEQVDQDLQILRQAVDWVQVHTPIGHDYELRPLMAEFASTLRDELDYVREGQNATRMRIAFGNDRRVWIPRVYDELTTTRVLTMERVGGIKFTDAARLDRLGISRRALAETAVRLFLRQVFELGFFHADPHPGNFFVQQSGTLAVVDFGMVGRLSEPTQRHLMAAMLAGVREDAEALAEELYALGVAGARADRVSFERDLARLVNRYGSSSIRDLSAATVTDELFSIAFRHKLQLPSELAQLLRVINMAEGLGLSLDPDFRYLEFATPVIKKLARRRYSPAALARRAGLAAVEAAELGADFPRRAARLLGRFERGEIAIKVDHRGLESATREFQKMTNRLVLAMLLAASIVALGLAAGIRMVPALEPVVDWLFRIALLFSLAFGVSVLWGMWRSGK
ncbi:MAG TPA: AarF/ABC1/UbiB kinase family protein [Candidatus Omnitrophota bacterium]|nr:AarF/ABC1/UbiB kinase family protein [Candidatus Omnitrophota bacterium]